LKKTAKVFSSILGIGVVVASAFVAFPQLVQQVFSHNAKPVSASSPTLLTHVNKEHLLGSTSATVTHVPETGKVASMNRMPGASQLAYSNKVVIVTFHDISPRVYSPYVITPEEFSADMATIGQNFHVISNPQFIDFMNHRGSVPQNAVLLTFDDGYQGMYSYALPILLAHHMSGTFFDIVGTADRNRPNSLTWDEMRRMAQVGMSMESHTYASHYEVTIGKKKILVPVFNTRIMVHGKRESVLAYHHRVLVDFRMARSELETNLNEPVLQLAWPYGWGSPFASLIAHEAGYEYLYTTKDGCVTPRTNRGRIPRIDIGKPLITPEEAVQMILETANGNRRPAKQINHV
jgi:peptidoglycan/xylan/chitin deacetylase (PgdA/CDA1 family)